jgi:ABC-type hemin transport system ATPase subunit
VIACHRVQETVAMKETLIAYESTDTKNLSDSMTKALSGGERQERLLMEVLYDI